MNDIYLVLNGQSSGPFTLAQVQEKLARNEITLETSAWREGAASWMPLGTLVPTLGVANTPLPPAPGIPAAVEPGAFTKPELRHIAKSQNLLMWSVLAGFAAFFIAHIPFLGLVIVLGIVAFQIYALYTLGSALRLPVVWLMCVGMFIPCVSLIILVLVSARASKVLKAAGVRVGLMGGNADDIKD